MHVPVYEMACPKCKKEFDVRLSLHEYETATVECEDCLIELQRHFRSAPVVNIPYQHQAAPETSKKKGLPVPINIIDQKPGGGYRVTRLGSKSQIDND